MAQISVGGFRNGMKLPAGKNIQKWQLHWEFIAASSCLIRLSHVKLNTSRSYFSSLNWLPLKEVSSSLPMPGLPPAHHVTFSTWSEMEYNSICTELPTQQTYKYHFRVHAGAVGQLGPKEAALSQKHNNFYEENQQWTYTYHLYYLSLCGLKLYFKTWDASTEISVRYYLRYSHWSLYDWGR